jgi:hypothetical protein
MSGRREAVGARSGRRSTCFPSPLRGAAELVSGVSLGH